MSVHHHFSSSSASTIPHLVDFLDFKGKDNVVGTIANLANVAFGLAQRTVLNVTDAQIHKDRQVLQ